MHFDLIEPLDHFFKDAVRALAWALGLPAHIVFRQPFPGPGLAIRVIGAVDKEKLEILKNADAIVREELDAYNQRLSSRPASATPSTAAGSISRSCPTSSPSALWATSAPISARSSCVPSSPAMP